MGRLSAKSRVYKDTTAQQLRSFHETARLGSFSAAAKSLGLANPTVWQQVRALELEFGEALLETRGRGCRLTEAGKLLADLIGPLVSGASTLKRRFHEARAQLAPRLSLVASPRILAEDLPECAAEFRRGQPEVHLALKELWDDQILAVVEAGEADVGLLHDRGPDLVRLNPWLEFQPVYEVDITLVTPLDHPLALKRHIRPADLGEYPLLNGLRGIPDLSVTAVLDKAGVCLSRPKMVEAIFTTTVCQYVRMGFGIGLIFTSSLSIPHPGLHHRVMNRHFGGTVVYQVRRKGTPPFQSVTTFMDVVKDQLKRAPKKS